MARSTIGEPSSGTCATSPGSTGDFGGVRLTTSAVDVAGARPGAGHDPRRRHRRRRHPARAHRPRSRRRVDCSRSPASTTGPRCSRPRPSRSPGSRRPGSWHSTSATAGRCPIPTALSTSSTPRSSSTTSNPMRPRTLLAEMARVARLGVVVNDLVRAGPGLIGRVAAEPRADAEPVHPPRRPDCRSGGRTRWPS